VSQQAALPCLWARLVRPVTASPVHFSWLGVTALMEAND
jgi:hypothetical protein